VPVEDLPDFDTQVGDAIAVLDAAGSESATIIGLNDGTIVASLLAAERPERCRSLVLFTLTAAHTFAAGMPMESIDDVRRDRRRSVSRRGMMRTWNHSPASS
jgi:pimeloyl-ACP methyl ester carboxylesterase